MKYRGSSLADEQYVDLFGQPGEYQQLPPGVRPRGPGVPAVPAPDPARPLLEPLDVLLRGMSGLTTARSRARRRDRARAGRVVPRLVPRARAGARASRGWVRNRADGAVEAEFEGPQAAVERMVAWCREGPPRARVDGVDVERIAPIGEPGFRVR